MTYKYEFVHVGGTEPCGKTAFYYDGPLDGEVRAELAMLPDGARPARGSPWLCGSCGERINMASVRTSSGLGAPVAQKPPVLSEG